MALEHESFEALAARLYANGGSIPGDERRRHQRTPVKGNIVATIMRAPAGPGDVRVVPITASVRDLSRSGIGLSCPRGLRRGEEFDLLVNLGNGVMRFTCRSCRCRLDDDNRYFIGALFLKIERAAQTLCGHDMLHPELAEPLDATGKEHLDQVQQRLNSMLDGEKQH
jgi:hypothetical protein